MNHSSKLSSILLCAIVLCIFISACTAAVRLYCVGENFFGECGLGNFEQVVVPVLVPLTGGLAGKTLDKVFSSAGASFVITSDGQLFVAGNNENGKLCLPIVETRVSNFTRVLGPLSTKRVVKVASSNNMGHTLILTEDHMVYGCGDNSNGELGLGFIGGFRDTPTLIPTSVANVPCSDLDVAAGDGHSLVVCSTGSSRFVLSFGLNDRGELGLGVVSPPHPTPTVIPSFATTGANIPAQVVAGGNTSFVITESGLVYSFGNNIFFQDEQPFRALLGTGVAADFNPVPSLVPIPNNQRVVQLAFEVDHALALTANNIIFAWGNNFFGQLGNNFMRNAAGQLLSDVPTPVIQSGALAGRQIVQVEVARISMALTSVGRLYSWGNDEFGNTAIIQPINQNVFPVPFLANAGPLANQFITMVTTSLIHSLFLSNGTLSPICGGRFCPSFNLCCQDQALGQVCYDPNLYDCVNGRALCPKGLLACGFTGTPACYNPNQYDCIGGAILCPRGNLVCAGSCYDPTRYFCCVSGPRGSVQKLCQIGQEATCCPPQ